MNPQTLHPTARRFQDALRFLGDWFYPRACAGCGDGSPTAGRYLCWDCLARVDFIRPPYCELCGDPVPGRIGHAYTCAWCSARRIHFRQARSAARYDGPLAQMIRDFKYHGHLWLARDLAGLLEAVVRTHFEEALFDVVTAVPLHPLKERMRGYNQSAMLAEVLARKLDLPFYARLMFRRRPTPTQTHLTAEQRIANVRDAFGTRWCRWLEGRRVLLVDDVMTTGATVNECARALIAGGAATVDVVTVARG